MIRWTSPSFRLFATLLLAGCATGADYQSPTAMPPAGWSAPLPHDGNTESLVGWWSQFHDPVLTKLLDAAEKDNPTLDIAFAAIEKSRATVKTAEASALPSLDVTGTSNRAATKNGTDTVIGNTQSGVLDASWEIDLFGKISQQKDAATARAQASIASWHDARVTLAAEVADTYTQYRACQQLLSITHDTLVSEQETERATKAAVKAGLTAAADGALISAAVAETASSEVTQKAACDTLIKGLVATTGMPETDLRPLLDGSASDLPKPDTFDVTAVPASALNQRPDLYALEREVAATYAEIGVAKADQYPSLTLSGSITRSGANLGSLLTTWLLGPSLSFPLFDGGERAAAVDTANASYASAMASYKQGVRTSIKEVENALVSLDSATQQTKNAQDALTRKKQYAASQKAYWRAGGVSQLTFETAQRTALSAQQTLVQAQRDQIEAWISLYKALGGGWTVATNQTTTTPLSGEKK